MHRPPRDPETYRLPLFSPELPELEEIGLPSLRDILASLRATHLARSWQPGGLVTLSCWHDVFISGTTAQRCQAWEEYMSHKTMETILYIVLDNYLCGFSKDDLIRSVNSSVDANRVNVGLQSPFAVRKLKAYTL